MLRLERLEDRTLLSGQGTSLANAILLPLTGSFSGSFQSAQPSYYEITLTQPGRFQAQMHVAGGAASLALLDDAGTFLVQNAGQSLEQPDATLDQHLDGSVGGTNYFLAIQSRTAAAAAFQITTSFTPSIPPFQPLPVGDTVTAIQSARLDADTFADLVTTNRDTGDISILLGKGDGTFNAPLRYRVGTQPSDAVIGDFNGDSYPDLAVANAGSNSVTVLLGKGDGTFPNAVSYTVGTHPFAIAAADFDGDHILDLATADNASQDISILPGNGDGTFRAAQAIPLAVSPAAFLTADLNHDNRIDCAVVSQEGQYLTILLNQPNGHWLTVPDPVPGADQTELGVDPVALVGWDFDGDQVLDLAISNRTSHDITVLQGRGDGTFGQPSRLPLVGSGGRLITLDVNQDGAFDLVAPDGGTNVISVLLGNGDGTFADHQEYPVTQGIVPGVANPISLTASDFNGDMVVDLAVANTGTQNIWPLLGLGNGAFLNQVQANTRFKGSKGVQRGLNPVAIVGGNFSGNGNLDLVTANRDSGDLTFFQGNNNSTFVNRGGFAVGVQPVALVAAQLDGDPALDLAAADFGSNDVSILFNSNNGFFSEHVNKKGNPIRPAVGTQPTGIVAGDFDGDKITDLVTCNRGSNDISVLLGNGPDGKANGTFQPAVAYDVGGRAPVGLVAGDFNGDQYLDLAVANAKSKDISILLGDGAGHFILSGTNPLAGIPAAIVAGRFRGDEAPLDLAVSIPGQNVVRAFLGQGDGSFGEPITIAVGQKPLGLIAADLNGDHRADLAVADSASNDVAIIYSRVDGSLFLSASYPVVDSPTAILGGPTTGNFYRDRAPIVDLVTVNSQTNNLTSLANAAGDGVYRSRAVYSGDAHPFAVVVGDFNHDQVPDIATANRDAQAVSVLYGLGDGTFQPPVQFPVPEKPTSLIKADINSDGLDDLVVVERTPKRLSVLLGQPDGSFRLGPQEIQVLPLKVGKRNFGADPRAVAAGDFNGDGKIDLAVANFGASYSDVLVLLGNGDGTFQAQMDNWLINGPARPGAIVIGDFNDDKILDAATANLDFQPAYDANGQPIIDPNDPSHTKQLQLGMSDVSILLGTGDGHFVDQGEIRVNTGAPNGAADYFFSITAADFNHDHQTDLATVNSVTQSVTVLIGLGTGTFAKLPPVRVGDGTDMLVADDFDGDGVLDIATANHASADISVLRGKGDGNLVNQQLVAVGTGPQAIAAADLNGDGNVDLVTGNTDQNAVGVFLGLGQGIFRNAVTPAIGSGPNAIVHGDFNADGRSDLITVNSNTSDLSVLLGNGDGTFHSEKRIALPQAPASIIAGDFNRDGRLDLAYVDARYRKTDPNDPNSTLEPYGEFTLLLGNGDGSFAAPQTQELGIKPTAIVAGDFYGKHRLDLAVADFRLQKLFILQNQPGGIFVLGQELPLDEFPHGLIAADFDQDGILDLAILNSEANSISVLHGESGAHRGRFAVPQSYPVGGHPNAFVAGDFNSDGSLDLAITNLLSSDVSILANDGRGQFLPEQRLNLGGAVNPVDLVTANLDGDAFPDLVVLSALSNDVNLLRGQRVGFLEPARVPVTGTRPTAMVADDFNGDGVTDLAAASRQSNNIAILMSLGLDRGQVSFVDPGSVANPVQSTPLYQDLNGDGIIDSLIVNRSGTILYRRGRGDGGFDAPIAVNATIGQTAAAARDVAVVATPAGNWIAAIQANQPAIQFYRIDADNRVLSKGKVATGRLPVRAVAGDLNGDGLADLAVLNAGNGSISLLWQATNGAFQPGPTLSSGGLGVSDLTLADADGDGRLDLLVTNQVSATVSVFQNRGNGAFSPPSVFRAGVNTAGLVSLSGRVVAASLDGTATVAVGQLNADGYPDLVVANSQSNTVAVLSGIGAGGFGRPQIYPTGDRPSSVVVGDFNGDHHADFAVLDEIGDNILVYLNDGTGQFSRSEGSDQRPFAISAGNAPTGLVVNQNHGRLDLAVGNAYGDVLTLQGTGQGTFAPFKRADREVTLAVSDLNGDGQPDFVLANQAVDQVRIEYSTSTTVPDVRAGGPLLAPGAVQLADLNGDGLQDLVVANTGGNDVLVFMGEANGRFALDPIQAYTGTNPVGITIHDLNNDTAPDLIVANEGSNDVSILFGGGVSGNYALTPGPRLRVGQGPDSTLILPGNGNPNLLVANSQSNDVWLLPGVGGGFFDDQNPKKLPTGPDPILPSPDPHAPSQPPPVTINGDGSLTILSPNFDSATTMQFGSGGTISSVFGDFDHNGTTDLLTANATDGVLTVLLGRGDTFETIQRSLGADVHPTGLAFAGGPNNGVSLYAAAEGMDQPLSLFIPFPIAPVPPGPPPAALPDLIDLTPLREASLASIATLLTATEETGVLVASADRARVEDGLIVDSGGDDPNNNAPATENQEDIFPGLDFLLEFDDRLPADAPRPRRRTADGDLQPDPRQAAIDFYFANVAAEAGQLTGPGSPLPVDAPEEMLSAPNGKSGSISEPASSKANTESKEEVGGPMAERAATIDLDRAAATTARRETREEEPVATPSPVSQKSLSAPIYAALVACGFYAAVPRETRPREGRRQRPLRS